MNIDLILSRERTDDLQNTTLKTITKENPPLQRQEKTKLALHYILWEKFWDITALTGYGFNHVQRHKTENTRLIKLDMSRAGLWQRVQVPCIRRIIPTGCRRRQESRSWNSILQTKSYGGKVSCGHITVEENLITLHSFMIGAREAVWEHKGDISRGWWWCTRISLQSCPETSDGDHKTDKTRHIPCWFVTEGTNVVHQQYHLHRLQKKT